MKRLVASLTCAVALALPGVALADGQKPKPNENAAIHSMCSSQHQFDYYKDAWYQVFIGYAVLAQNATDPALKEQYANAAGVAGYWYWATDYICRQFNPDLV